MTNAICDGAQERVSTSDEVDWPFGDIADPETGDTVDEVAPSAQRFVKLPNTALGKLLDNGRASAHAIKLLAIKVSKGTHVLNERAVDKYFGVGRRGFRAGIALLKEAGLLHRVNHGRRFAREKLLDGSGGFVALPACLLTKRADVLAFIAAVLVSPEPMTARKAADRIGVKPKSRNSVYALVKAAEPFIKSSKGPRGVILVARQSHVFEQVADVRKNVLLKNVLLKNVPTHREMEEEHRKKKEVHRETEEDHPSPSRGEGIPPSPPLGGARAGALAHWRILRDWKQSKFFREHGVYNTSDEMKDWVHNPAHWRHLIERFGGAPGHLFTPHSYLQAVELAHELAARTRYRLRVIDALRGLAFAVCEAHRAGDDIRSLGFIGAHLAGKILKDELAWAFAFQTRLSTERHDAVLSFALRWIAALEKVNWSLHKDSLLPTFELEELDRILASCKNDETAVWKALGGGKPAEEGKSVCGWWWWSEQIEQLQKEQKPAKRRRRSNCLGSWPR